MPTVKSKTVIGPVALLDFPAQKLTQIPAKVDTGADSSALWASEIIEKKNGISFKFFDQKSPFYNAKTYTFKDYTKSIIRNSFGRTERRYKVVVPVSIEGRTIRAKFTLANRANLKYPALIGKKTLANKFLVDVNKKESPNSGKLKNKKRILMLYNRPIGSIKKMSENIMAETGKTIEITCAAYSDLAVQIDRSIKMFLPKQNVTVNDFDLIWLKTKDEKFIADIALTRFADLQDIAVTGDKSSLSTDNKLYQYVLLSANGIPIPGTLYYPMSDPKSFFEQAAKLFSKPFIVKDVMGQKGNDNFLISTYSDFERICKTAKSKGIHLVAQKYVGNDGDYRILIMGGKAEMVIHRKRKSDKTHLNNVSRGGEAFLIEPAKLPKEVIKNAVKAAKILDLDIAGVDMIKDKDSGLWYCLEVNDTPQLASGAFVGQKRKALINFLQKRR